MCMCSVASWNAVEGHINIGRGMRMQERAKQQGLPVLIQKANYARAACFSVTRFVLLASLRDLARIVIPSDGDDFAKTLELCL
jgi:hypothetical protein